MSITSVARGIQAMQFAEYDPFSSNSTMMKDLRWTFAHFKDRKTVNDKDLQMKISEIQRTVVLRLSQLTSTDILLSLVALALLSQKLMENKLHGFSSFICLLSDLAPKIYNKMHQERASNTWLKLYEDAKWLHTLKEVFIQNSSFQQKCAACCQETTRFIDLKKLNSASLDKIDLPASESTLSAEHPWHLYNDCTEKTAMHHWYALCFSFHTLFAKELAEETCTQGLLSWRERGSKGAHELIESSAFLSFFTTFFTYKEPSKPEEVVQPPVEKKGSILCALLFRRDRGDSAPPSPSTTVTSPRSGSTPPSPIPSPRSQHSSMGLALTAQPSNSQGSIKQQIKPLSLSMGVLPHASIRATSSFSPRRIEAPSQDVTFHSLCTSAQKPCTLDTWLAREEAYSLLRKVLSHTDIFDVSFFLEALQKKYTYQTLPENIGEHSSSGRGASWLTDADSWTANVFQEYIDQKKIPPEAVLTYFRLLMCAPKVEIGCRLKLAASMLKCIEGMPIKIMTSKHEITIKQLFETLMLVFSEAATNGLKQENDTVRQKFTDLIESLFNTKWLVETSVIQDETDSLSVFDTIQGHIQDIAGTICDKQIIRTKTYKNCITSCLYTLERLEYSKDNEQSICVKNALIKNLITQLRAFTKMLQEASQNTSPVHELATIYLQIRGCLSEKISCCAKKTDFSSEIIVTFDGAKYQLQQGATVLSEWDFKP